MQHNGSVSAHFICLGRTEECDADERCEQENWFA